MFGVIKKELINQMKLTSKENCGLQSTSQQQFPSFSLSAKQASSVVQSQKFSWTPNSTNDHLVSLIRPGWNDAETVKRQSNEGQRTEISTLGSASDQLPDDRQMMKEAEAIVAKVNEGLQREILPQKNVAGTSGVYLMKDVRRNLVAVFKPTDEEPTVKLGSCDTPSEFRVKRARSCNLSDNKDSALPHQTSPNKRLRAPRTGLFSGELCLREVGAHLLDSEGLHGVPTTAMVRVQQRAFGAAGATSGSELSEKYRIGSLQRYVSNNGVSSNISCSKFSVFEVQKIALLDLRILNADRNEANVLFKRDSQDQIRLIPIDHALSIPDSLELYQSDLCWLDWPQSREPLDPALVQYVARINPETDATMLQSRLGIRDECAFNLRIAEVFLKLAVARNFSLSKIAQMMYRSNEFSKSALEKLVEKTRLTFDMLRRRAEKSPKRSEQHNEFTPTDPKKHIFTPQKVPIRFTQMTPFTDTFEANSDDGNGRRPLGFLIGRTISSNLPQIAMDIFPKSISLSAARSIIYDGLSSKDKTDDVQSHLNTLITGLPEMPDFGGYCVKEPKHDNKDQTFNKTTALHSINAETLSPERNLEAITKSQLLDVLSCGPQKKQQQRETRASEVMPTRRTKEPLKRSATQDRKRTSDEQHDRLSLFPNLSNSDESPAALFFDCFTLNATRYLDERVKKVPRKYTVHAGSKNTFE